MGLLVIGAAIAALVLFGMKGKSAPPGPAGNKMSASDVQHAVDVALAHETDPHKLLEFADSLEPDYHSFALELRARAAELTGQPSLAGGTVRYATYDIDTFEKKYPAMAPYVEDAPVPHQLVPGMQLILILKPSNGAFPWVPVPVTVAQGDPQASIGYVTTHVSVSLPGGPSAGSEMRISTIEEDDTYFDVSSNADGGLARFFASNGWPNLFGGGGGGGGGALVLNDPNEPGGGGGPGEPGGGGGLLGEVG